VNELIMNGHNHGPGSTMN